MATMRGNPAIMAVWDISRLSGPKRGAAAVSETVSKRCHKLWLLDEGAEQN